MRKCSTDAVTMIVGPASEERIQRIDELGRVAPAAWRQSVLTLAVMACTLALLGVIWSLAALPLGRTCLRTVCPKVKALCEWGNDRLMGRAAPACG